MTHPRRFLTGSSLLMFAMATLFFLASPFLAIIYDSVWVFMGLTFLVLWLYWAALES